MIIYYSTVYVLVKIIKILGAMPLLMGRFDITKMGQSGKKKKKNTAAFNSLLSCSVSIIMMWVSMLSTMNN